jgi:hypothetical protein
MNTKMATHLTAQLPTGCSARAGKLSDYPLAFELVNQYAQHINGRKELNDPELIRLD